MALDIAPLDAYDDEAMAAWHATYVASAVFERPHATPFVLEETRAEFRADSLVACRR